MGNQVRPVPAYADQPWAPSHEAVRRLIKTVERELEHTRAAEDSDVMLDAQVDGVRCLLVRTVRRPPLERSLVLSPREQEIARMVAKGYPNKTIASVLDISSWTVGTHLRRIFAKLGVSSRAAMVARLSEEGLVHEWGPAGRDSGQRSTSLTQPA
jgi:DNA-binding CsgD family transcriptional regulator